MRFRKRPVEVDAVQMPTKSGDFSAAPTWVAAAFAAGDVHYVDEQRFNVQTHGDQRSVMCGDAGDFLVKDEAGNIYPMRRGVFLAMYEAA